MHFRDRDIEADAEFPLPPTTQISIRDLHSHVIQETAQILEVVEELYSDGITPPMSSNK